MANKHTATSAITGETFKRTSADRIYSHCYIVHFSGNTSSDGRVWPPSVYAGGWASTELLARKAAARYNGSDKYRVEIVPATMVETKRRGICT